MRIQTAILDDKLVYRVQCPNCDAWGEVDEDQLLGGVSMMCDCGWHQTMTEATRAHPMNRDWV